MDVETPEQLWNRYKTATTADGFPAMLHHGFLAAVNSYEPMREALRACMEALEDLRSLKSHHRITNHNPIHKYECPSWRFGKRHGPCNCGGDEISERIIAKAYDAADAALAHAREVMREK